MSVNYERKAEELEERCRSIPEIPERFYDWVKHRFTNSWLFYRRRGRYYADMFCCACGKEYTVKIKRTSDSFESQFEHIEQVPIHNNLGRCPKCGEVVIYKTGLKKDKYEQNINVYLGQKYKEKGYVLRYFKVYKEYGPDKKDEYDFCEVGRCFYEEGKKKAQEDWQKYSWSTGKEFWDYCNIQSMHPITMESGYIYPGTYEAMKGTVLEYSMVREYITKKRTGPVKWSTDFYCMRDYLNAYFRYPIMEMFVKKDCMKFAQQLEWSRGRSNPLEINTRAKTPYDMLRVRKERLSEVMQKGSMAYLEWVQYEKKSGKVIKNNVIDYFQQKGIHPYEVESMLKRMTPEQAMNYIEKQIGTSYNGAKTVATQYEDYMRMAKELGKDTSDEMIFRPRELKKRHNQLVSEKEMLAAVLEADKYSQKYAKAEEVLKKIKKKFEYAGEEYKIIVPERIVDIVLEGRCLHHCVGNSDRYFDRIKSHETYICFLRKNSEPEIAFYTIEVEPGGTIRQHRGEYDEEPEIEKVKPFLIEWQSVIKMRMSEDDRKLAKMSKEKREENIEELRAKNNTRVLEGLMEDFMEAI